MKRPRPASGLPRLCHSHPNYFHHHRHAQQRSTRVFSSTPTPRGSLGGAGGKDLFTLRAEAKEGLWIANNASPRLSASDAARLSPAVQLLEAENNLANAVASQKAREEGSDTAATFRRKARIMQQLQQQQQAERDRMASVLRERQRERNRDGKPLFWIENTSSLPLRAPLLKSSPLGATAAMAAGGVGGRNSIGAGPGAGTGSYTGRPTASSSSVLAFLALLSLPIVFGLGRRYEIAQRSGTPATVVGVPRVAPVDKDAERVEDGGQTIAIVTSDLGKRDADAVFASAGLVPDRENETTITASTSSDVEVEVVADGGSGRSNGWFWSNSSD